MPLTIGTTAPDFRFQTADGSGLLSEELQKAEKTLLIFSRYLGCPFCQLDLLSYCEEYARFREKNAQILLVLQSSPETLRQQTLAKEVPFLLISDPQQELYHLYEVKPAASMLKMLRLNGKLLKKASALMKRKLKHGAYEGNEQQLPALFIIGKDGTVEVAHYARSMGDMPTVDEVLAKLDNRRQMPGWE